MSYCDQPELIRVYFPGVSATDVVEEYGGSFSNTITVQDLLNLGILYPLDNFNGTTIICAMVTCGKAGMFIRVGGVEKYPLPMPVVEFVGGRPNDRRLV